MNNLFVLSDITFEIRHLQQMLESTVLMVETGFSYLTLISHLLLLASISLLLALMYLQADLNGSYYDVST